MQRATDNITIRQGDTAVIRLDDNGIISAAAALNPSNWPSDEDERILYGDEKLLAIHKTLAVEAATSPILLKEFDEFKCHGVTGESMRKVLTAVSTLLVCTAECERARGASAGPGSGSGDIHRTRGEAEPAEWTNSVRPGRCCDRTQSSKSQRR
ncbi:unnamed protein product [Gadus morhua 'NCC']